MREKAIGQWLVLLVLLSMGVTEVNGQSKSALCGKKIHPLIAEINNGLQVPILLEMDSSSIG